MTSFRVRRFESGDEFSLNKTYNQVVAGGRGKWPRPLDAMQWIWHNAPGGPADSWIIEVSGTTGWRIVGHHALCPVRFTFGDQDLLCAKTINSFLLPEFRDKFLYLRFEQECLKEADHRFDATYTVAPRSVRLRSGLGYTNFGTWIQFERRLRPFSIAFRAVRYLTRRYSHPPGARLSRMLASLSSSTIQSAPLALVEHGQFDAKLATFFAEFWSQARTNAGMAPQRDFPDIEWRYLKRPGFVGSALTYAGPGDSRAYFIVDTFNPLFHSLSDFYISPMRPELCAALLEALFAWCFRRGALALKFRTVAQGLPAPILAVFASKMKVFPLQRFFPISEFPRRFSNMGKARLRNVLPDWNTTEILVADAF